MTGKILIVDDVATNRIVLKVKLASAYYETFQASNGAEALRIAREVRPDLVLLDVELPDMSGISVCQELKADPATRNIPVVMITAFHDPERRLESLRAGAEDVFWKPLDEVVLLARLRSLLRARETQDQLGLRDETYQTFGFCEPSQPYAASGVIGFVSGLPDQALFWKRALQPLISHRIVVLDRRSALGDLKNGEVPDVYVVASDLMEHGDGLRFLSELRSNPTTRHSAVCLMLSSAARDTSAIALDLGANDLFEPAIDPAEMALRLGTQLAHKRQADQQRTSVAAGLRLAMIDPLTGLHNRRYALPHLARIAEHARNTGRQFAVLALDLDRFKLVNDTFGHAAGDAVLVDIAERLRSNIRTVDLLARVGGEEFLIALPDTSLEAARATAERLRHAVSDTPIRVPGGAQLSVTMSIGLTMGGGTEDTSPVDATLTRADGALFIAKAEGRNQVTVNRSAA